MQLTVHSKQHRATSRVRRDIIVIIALFMLQTKIAVRRYNLLKQELTKKLFTNCRWVSSFAVHPRGVLCHIITVLIVSMNDCFPVQHLLCN